MKSYWLILAFIGIAATAAYAFAANAAQDGVIERLVEVINNQKRPSLYVDLMNLNEPLEGGFKGQVECNRWGYKNFDVIEGNGKPAGIVCYDDSYKAE